MMKTIFVFLALVLGSTIAINFDSCKELYDQGVRCNGRYKVGCQLEYCHLQAIQGCGPGPWTLVMKIDGRKNTFKYNSKLWSNNDEYLPRNGDFGLDDKETKLSTFSNTPFTTICMGMKKHGGNQQPKFFATRVHAKSLYSLVADGKFRASRATKASWLGLLKGSALQENCNQQGFNVGGLVRIGMRTNQEKNCKSCDSWIGFGGNGWGGNTCGNFANAKWNRNKGADIKYMGYILVK